MACPANPEGCKQLWLCFWIYRNPAASSGLGRGDIQPEIDEIIHYFQNGKLKGRIDIYLVGCRDYGSAFKKTLDLFFVEVADADGLGQALFAHFLHSFPSIDIVIVTVQKLSVRSQRKEIISFLKKISSRSFKI